MKLLFNSKQNVYEMIWRIDPITYEIGKMYLKICKSIKSVKYSNNIIDGKVNTHYRPEHDDIILIC